MGVSITQNPTKLMDCPFGPTEVGKGRKKNTCGKKNLCHNWEMNPYLLLVQPVH